MGPCLDTLLLATPPVTYRLRDQRQQAQTEIQRRIHRQQILVHLDAECGVVLDEVEQDAVERYREDVDGRLHPVMNDVHA